MVVGLRLHETDPAEPDVDEPFRSMVGRLIWSANHPCLGILNAVRAMAKYIHAKFVLWRAALHVLMYGRFTSSYYGITFWRGTPGGLGLEMFVESHFASQSYRREVPGLLLAVLSCLLAVLACRFVEDAETVAMIEGCKEARFLQYGTYTSLWSLSFFRIVT